MQLKQFIKDREGVSPVIGVILMVAITVILAAVIGTFVLGLGDQVGDTAPNANWDAEVTDVSDAAEMDVTVQFTHEGGDSVEGDTLSGNFAGDGLQTDGLDDSDINEDVRYTAGDSLDIVLSTTSGDDLDGTVSLVWESSDRSSVLREYEVYEEND